MRLRQKSFSRGARRAAFPDVARVPAEIAAVLARPDKRRMDAVLDLLLSGEAPGPVPHLPSLLAWGAEDRLADAAAARALAASRPDCEPALLPGAGHLPQCDSPEKFTALLSHFAAAHGDGPSIA
jgi:pimeloyl-ACP methyl ester carboxylesterase